MNMTLIGGKVANQKKIDNEQFEKLAQKQKDGIITVADCCRELGISRSTWYDRVRKVGV